MSRLSKFALRLPQAAIQQLNKSSASPTGDYVSKTINDALVSAGLLAPQPTAKTADAPGLLVPTPAPAAAIAQQRATISGEFVELSYSDQVGSRRYKLYVPASYRADAGVSYPLFVMLHGCKQSPDDFAAGTDMNTLADQHGFFVAYPAQSTNANGSKCWNWFLPEHQAREGGEAALLAGLTRQVLAQNPIDPERVFVAGLSAGAAMAVILGTNFPELYKGVGAHSGLPYGAARDIPSAFAAMGGSASSRATSSGTSLPGQAHAPVTPMIVFHGDADRTVAPGNGSAIVEQALGPASALSPASRVSGTTTDGAKFTRSVHTTALGEPFVEYWEIHGAGHAWSGGNSSGSYTDAGGPDASAEMVRFFLRPAENQSDPAKG